MFILSKVSMNSFRVFSDFLNQKNVVQEKIMNEYLAKNNKSFKADQSINWITHQKCKDMSILSKVTISGCSRDSRPRDWSRLGAIFLVSVSPIISRDSRDSNP